MEQRELFGNSGTSPKQTITFNLAESRVLVVDAATGEVMTSSDNVTVAERLAADAIRKDYHNKWASFRYVIRSAMHKEIRRGDVVAAVKWARLFAIADGDSQVKQYAKKILFEETRNMTLFQAWRSVRGLDGETMVRQLAASAKKWELPTRAGLFARYTLAYKNVVVRAKATYDVPISAVESEADAAVGSRDLDRLYELFWRVQLAQNDNLSAALDAKLQEHLAQVDDPGADLGSNWYKFFYTPKIAMEILAGAWDDRANKLTRDPNIEVPKLTTIEVPVLADYVYDNHTRPGLARYVKHLASIQPKRPLPHGLDLRWSGMVRGVCWREHAFEQFGAEYASKQWHEVDIPETVWETVNYADAFFYAALYRRAHIKGVPFPRE